MADSRPSAKRLPPVRLEPGGLSMVSDERRRALRERLRRRHWVRLPGFFPAPLLRSCRERVSQAAFHQQDLAEDTVTPHHGRREVGDAHLNVLFGMLLSDRKLFELVRFVGDVPAPIRRTTGSVFKVDSRSGHYLIWHRDPAYLTWAGRCAGVTLMVNLGGPYRGGTTFVRTPDGRIERFSMLRAGDAVLFRGGLDHRTSPVLGRRPKLTYTAWFFLDSRVARRLPAHHRNAYG